MKRRFALVLAFSAFVLCPPLHAQRADDTKYSSPRLSKTETLNDAKAILINNLFTYFYNNGLGALNPFTNDDGLEVKTGLYSRSPYVLMNGSMFSEGLVWGCSQRGAVKVGGATYKGGLQAGPIVTPGTAAARPMAADPTNGRYRIYRVRPDVSAAVPFAQAGTLLSNQEVSYLSRYEQAASARTLYDQYIRDWNEWPGAEGAPYTDVDRNGVYDPAIDVPGVPGADQTLWYAANDMDSLLTKALYGSLPIGIEMQRTIWAYHRPGAIDNTIFQRTRLINKSGVRLDSMFVTQFTDPDIGGSLGYTDDYVGCDTVRNMGYVYNGTNRDGLYGAHPPAVGMDLLAGPAVPGSPADSAFVNFSYRKGWKNQFMTSMVMILKNTDEAILNDPRGTTQWYNIMKGLLKTGDPVVNPQTQTVTTFVFPGDPETQTGWVEGTLYKPAWNILSPADRRMAMTSGPFTMAPADTQEVLFAEMVGIGADRIGSLAALRSTDDAVEKIFRNGFRLPAMPVAPVVTVKELNGRILLNWADAASASRVEAYASAGYRFQGYNVYQYAKGDPGAGKRVATYDLVDDVQWVIDTVYDAAVNMVVPKKTAFGGNSGLAHFYSSAFDSLTGARMVNGTKYYYAVTSYAYSAAGAAGTRIIETTPVILETTPQSPPAGTVLPTQFGQILSDDASRVRSVGMKVRPVIVMVVDPTAVSGHTYSVIFSEPGVNAKWSIFDSTTNTMAVTNQSNYTKNFTYTANGSAFVNDPADPVVDGLQFSVVTAPATAAYQWTLSTARLGRTYSAEKAITDLQRINVYPNPYFAGNTLETDKYQHFVTFNHLPQKAVINIHTLSGVRLRALVKDDPSQFFKWDLTNESGTPVAAGMYVVYISLPDLGVQKILKLAVIPAATIPDHW